VKVNIFLFLLLVSCAAPDPNILEESVDGHDLGDVKESLSSTLSSVQAGEEAPHQPYVKDLMQSVERYIKTLEERIKTNTPILPPRTCSSCSAHDTWQRAIRTIKLSIEKFVKDVQQCQKAENSSLNLSNCIIKPIVELTNEFKALLDLDQEAQRKSQTNDQDPLSNLAVECKESSNQISLSIGLNQYQFSKGQPPFRELKDCEKLASTLKIKLNSHIQQVTSSRMTNIGILYPSLFTNDPSSSQMAEVDDYFRKHSSTSKYQTMIESNSVNYKTILVLISTEYGDRNPPVIDKLMDLDDLPNQRGFYEGSIKNLPIVSLFKKNFLKKEDFLNLNTYRKTALNVGPWRDQDSQVVPPHLEMLLSLEIHGNQSSPYAGNPVLPDLQLIYIEEQSQF
jgi:hypothetical protein